MVIFLIYLKKDLFIYPNAKLLVGHSLKAYVDFQEFQSQLEWFTFLRDPIKRYLSHYIHQQTSNNDMHKMDIHRWSKRFRRQNLMVRMIAGEESLSKAIEDLESKFKFVGLTEYFNDSMLMLKTKFKWDYFDPRLNELKMTGRNNDIKAEIIGNYHKYEDCLYENNNLDIELYEYVVNYLWPKQVDSLMATSTDESSYLPKTQHKRNISSMKLKRNLLYRPYVFLDNLSMKF